MPPLVSRARSRRWWRRRLRAAFSERLALKGTAVALALVLWFTVTVQEQAEHVVSVRFLPTLDPGVALAGPPPPIRALVRGSGRDILKLYSTPPAIRRTISDVAGDTMTLQLRTDEVDLPPGTSASVRNVQPRRILLRFERTGPRIRRRAGEATLPLPSPSQPQPQPQPPSQAQPQHQSQPQSQSPSSSSSSSSSSQSQSPTQPPSTPTTGTVPPKRPTASVPDSANAADSADTRDTVRAGVRDSAARAARDTTAARRPPRLP